jgi:DNA-directed RNA polymerase subunit RPC12/RpoP
VIRFSCKNCGHKISVEDEHSGRRGKCPKCGKILLVPDKSNIVTFRCGNCGRNINVSKKYTGKKGKCPKCGNIIVIPEIEDAKPVTSQIESGTLLMSPAASVLDPSLFKVPPGVGRAATWPDGHNGLSESAQELVRRPEEDKAEAAGQRKLPWIIDIFLYPTSVPGLTVIGVIIAIPLLIDILSILLGPFGFFVSIPGFFVKIVVGLYIYWYFCECIRDSAEGGLRAPETVGSMASLGEMFWQFLRLVACYAFFFGPVTFYVAYNDFSYAKTSSAVFWSLQTYGIFFFPMGILAVVMFDSVKGLNPVLLIQSIISAFLQYCGLVILFYGLAVLFIIGIVGLVLAGIAGGWVLLALLILLLVSVVFIWLLFVAGHLLGRFYWKYQGKLNWEV